jgi:hypothetical protein
MQSSKGVIPEIPTVEVVITPLPAPAVVPDVSSNEKPPEYESATRASPPPEIAVFDERPAFIA